MKAAFDHNGKEFKSVAAMCREYEITPQEYNKRMHVLGWSLEKTLTTPTGKNKGLETVDHLGNKYSSIAEKCKAHNVPETTYRDRIKNGLSEEEALSSPNKVYDPVTKKYFPSYQKLCAEVGINYNTFKSRTRKGKNGGGYTPEEAIRIGRDLSYIFNKKNIRSRISNELVTFYDEIRLDTDDKAVCDGICMYDKVAEVEDDISMMYAVIKPQYRDKYSTYVNMQDFYTDHHIFEEDFDVQLFYKTVEMVFENR